ncbi:hypothetical protein [Arthrobacter zhaoxinii]|uniref:hypothetical protein n=1 Tax=Arthrobacter zhaoxinii TaxID=2964616 RepID=UPI0027E37AB0|nr:hypothetical protein [Arthrobacter zhaoxinii]
MPGEVRDGHLEVGSANVHSEHNPAARLERNPGRRPPTGGYGILNEPYEAQVHKGFDPKCDGGARQPHLLGEL